MDRLRGMIEVVVAARIEEADNICLFDLKRELLE